MNKFDNDFQVTVFIILKGNINGVGQSYFHFMHLSQTLSAMCPPSTLKLILGMVMFA